MNFECLYHQSIPWFKRFVHSICTSILFACREMVTQTNLLGFFGKVIDRKRKSQTNITSFFKKADQNHEKNDDVIYVGSMYFLLTIHSFCNDYYFCLI